MGYPCWNHVYGCQNQVAQPYDLCPECFEAEGDETVAESWQQAGTWSNLCQHGRDIQDCLQCNPTDW